MIISEWGLIERVLLAGVFTICSEYKYTYVRTRISRSHSIQPSTVFCSATVLCSTACTDLIRCTSKLFNRSFLDNRIWISKPLGYRHRTGSAFSSNSLSGLNEFAHNHSVNWSLSLLPIWHTSAIYYAIINSQFSHEFNIIKYSHIYDAFIEEHYKRYGKRDHTFSMTFLRLVIFSLKIFVV